MPASPVLDVYLPKSSSTGTGAPPNGWSPTAPITVADVADLAAVAGRADLVRARRAVDVRQAAPADLVVGHGQQPRARADAEEAGAGVADRAAARGGAVVAAPRRALLRRRRASTSARRAHDRRPPVVVGEQHALGRQAHQLQVRVGEVELHRGPRPDAVVRHELVDPAVAQGVQPRVGELVLGDRHDPGLRGAGEDEHERGGCEGEAAERGHDAANGPGKQNLRAHYL